MNVMKILGNGIKLVAGYVSKKSGDVGNTTVTAIGNTIGALGGRKFFYACWLTPAFVLVSALLKVDPLTIQLSLGVMAGAIGVEGIADIKERSGGSKDSGG